MTDYHIRRLNDYNKNQGDAHKQAVLNIFWKNRGKGIDNESECISPKMIEEFLKHEAEVAAQTRYENGEITQSERKKQVKENSITMRTIMRKLADLTEEGLINRHHNGLYSLSNKVRQDFRYFASEVGSEVIDALMANFYPTSNINQNIKQLVEMFGAFTIFCFVGASKPEVDYSLSSFERDEFSEKFIQSVLLLKTMYFYFLAIVKNMQPQQRQSAMKLAVKEMKFRTRHRSYEEYEKAGPFNELDNETIESLTNALKETYPHICKVLKEAHSNFLNRSKK